MHTQKVSDNCTYQMKYNSYNLLKKFYKNFKKKFTLILKLPESKKDEIKFNLKRFKKRS